MPRKKAPAKIIPLDHALDDDDPLTIPEFLRRKPGDTPPVAWDPNAKPKQPEFYVSKEIPAEVKEYLAEKAREEKIRTQNRIAEMKLRMQAKKVDRSQHTWDARKGRWRWAIPPWPLVRYNKDGSAIPLEKEATSMTNVDFGTTPAKKEAKSKAKAVKKAAAAKAPEKKGAKGKKPAASAKAAGEGPYGSRVGSNKEKLLTLLLKGKAVTVTEAVKAIYGNVKVEDKLGALPGVVAGVEAALKANGKTLTREGRGVEATLKAS
jgi:hypothetical protein